MSEETAVKAQARAQARPNPKLIATFFAMMAAAVLALTAAANAQTRPTSFADLAEKVSPAVVNITTATVVAQDTGPAPMVPEGSPFEDFFRDFLDRNGEGEQPRTRRSSALGSGFVISEDGYIVTNNHVIEGADEIVIEFFGNRGELDATVIGTDPNTDIALLKVETDEPLPFVPFGDSEAIRVGDWVMAMGNPLGQGFSISAGIISARGRELQGTYDDFLQTDAAINRGNSGGPLFNMDGQVIGVNTAILSPNGGSIGIGFAMASNVVTKVVDQLKEFGETRRGWLGVRIQDVSDDVAEAMGLSSTNGALVTDVPDGPAKDAGMEAGDLILSFAGEEVANTRELVRIVGNSGVGETVRVVVLRDGQTQTLKVVLGRREEALANDEGGSSNHSTPAPEVQQQTILGMTLSEMTDELREELGLDAGAQGLVVTAVQADSEAAAKGLIEGDVITEAGQQQLTSIAQLEERIASARDGGRQSLLLLVRRGGDPRFVALPVTE
jgi:serine protease Do